MALFTSTPLNPAPAGQSRATGSPICRVAVLGSEPETARVVEALRTCAGWLSAEAIPGVTEASGPRLEQFQAAVLVEGDDQGDGRGGDSAATTTAALALLKRIGLGAVVLADRAEAAADGKTGLVRLPSDCSAEMLHGALAALWQCRPVMQDVSKQLTGMQRLHESLHKHFDAIDRELRLASRLQRDFLPREIPQAGRVRFSTLFRPCTWVSGDIFDIFRLDEKRYGFYLADAVGHGVAAGLLTMYIKNAIKPKRILADGYELMRPSEVMSSLNDQLSAQDLPDSQFITGWYGVINVETLRLDYAIAGHPPPMLIDRGGLASELCGDGSLLGLLTGQRFSDETIQLKPGQRVVLYSDGLEPILIEERLPMPELPKLHGSASGLLTLPSEEMFSRIRALIDTAPGGLSHADDISMVVLDVPVE